MKRQRIVTLSMALALVLALLAPVAWAEGNFSEVAIFATNSAHLKDKANVQSGDVVVNDFSGGPTLDGDELSIGKESTVAGAVAADSIALDSSATVSGTIECNDGVGVTCGGLSLPVFPPAQLPQFRAAVVRPDAEDVAVGEGQSVSLDAGDYADITTGKTATVVFTGGIYNIGSMIAGDFSRIEFLATTELRILGVLSTGKEGFLGPAAGSTVAASDIIVYVGGTNLVPADPNSKPSAATLRDKSVVQANVWAANGTLRLEKEVVATGAFLGRDVLLVKSVQVNLDSFFANQIPTAFAQEVLTDGANDLEITLEGSDPEGGDLSFSIVVGPAEGTLGAITPTTPAPVDQCSQSGVPCTIDADCPGFAEGETCDTVQPPITQATVTYTPDLNNNCVTDPESGEVTCPEDAFTFGVIDDCDALGTAVVSINGATDEIPGDPGTGVDAVEANDLEADVVVSEVRVLTLSAAAPDTVAALIFRVETLPAGALQDSDGFAVVAGADLPSPVVTYQAPGIAGSDSFTFSARDSATTTPPCGPPSCDTGTVNVDVGTLPELAPDQEVGTDLNTPVEITLRANAGGSGGGTQSLDDISVTVTYGDNGPPFSLSMLKRLAALRGDKALKLSSTALGVDQGWEQFSWCDIATSPGCNDLVDLVNESPVIEGPFDFTITEASCLRVTDTLAKGDHWRVENLDGGNVDWTDFTSEVDQSNVGTTSDPDVAFGDLEYSHGEFDITAGAFSIRLTTIPPDSFAFGTAGYIRVDTGPCVDIVYTVTSLPAASTGTLTNLDGSAVQIGDTYFAETNVVFTPAFNFSGSTSFEYGVAQGGTVGVAVVDTAIIDLLVSETDPCALVGRPPGCVP